MQLRAVLALIYRDTGHFDLILVIAVDMATSSNKECLNQ